MKDIKLLFGPVIFVLLMVAVFTGQCEHRKSHDLKLELGLCRERDNSTYDSMLDLSRELYEAEKKIDSLECMNDNLWEAIEKCCDANDIGLCSNY